MKTLYSQFLHLCHRLFFAVLATLAALFLFYMVSGTVASVVFWIKVYAAVVIINLLWDGLILLWRQYKKYKDSDDNSGGLKEGNQKYAGVRPVPTNMKRPSPPLPQRPPNI
jgi:hypothetical protein